MTLPTLSRGVGARDDYVILAGHSTTVSGSVTSLTAASTDGDVYSVNIRFTNPNAGDQYQVTESGFLSPTLNSTTYSKILIRARIVSITGGSFTLSAYVHLTSGGDKYPAIIGTGVSSTFVLATDTVTAGDTVDELGFAIRANTTQTGVFDIVANIDFVQCFKETLTLPSVTRATPVPKKRYVTKIQVLQREGDVYQDLGSSSPEFHLGGSLITTSQYSADDWNRVFDGLVLEQATVQADGNPTWQWFNHDLWQRKVLVMDYTPQDVPGRQRNSMNDYTLRLVQS